MTLALPLSPPFLTRQFSFSLSSLPTTDSCLPLPPLSPSGILEMVGQAELEMASQITQYEIMLSNDVISPLTTMLEVSFCTD